MLKFTTAVVFHDDLGNMYYVIRTDNTQSKYDLEKVAAGYTINDALREKQIVPTTRVGVASREDPAGRQPHRPRDQGEAEDHSAEARSA